MVGYSNQFPARRKKWRWQISFFHLTAFFDTLKMTMFLRTSKIAMPLILSSSFRFYKRDLIIISYIWDIPSQFCATFSSHPGEYRHYKKIWKYLFYLGNDIWNVIVFSKEFCNYFLMYQHVLFVLFPLLCFLELSMEASDYYSETFSNLPFSFVQNMFFKKHLLPRWIYR